MTKARQEQINLAATPFYHVISRCVRRAYLCGQDEQTGKDYSHRKQWITNRLKYLASVFAIDIAAYAVMSNHYHTILHINQSKANSWENEEVIERCAKLFPNKAKIVKERFNISPLDPNLLVTLKEWRARLSDISWFMRCMNEPIARQSNEEDDCTGHFWQGRFKSQALLNEGAVLSAMVYVDLNPIRAKISHTPEDSAFTSIQERITAYNQSRLSKSNSQPLALMHFKDPFNLTDNLPVIDFTLKDYLKLVDETGRAIRDNKCGAIHHLSPILDRLNLRSSGWLSFVECIESHYAFAIGDKENLAAFYDYKRASKGALLSERYYHQRVA